MKNLTKISGFTLVELMISMGIGTALVLIIISSLKMSDSTKKTLERTTEINSLIQLITSELSKKQVCEVNFKGLTPTATPKNLSAITNKNGTTNLIAANAKYGEMISLVNTITYSGAVSASNPHLFKMNLIVNYQAKADAGKTITPKQFSIPINVFLDASGKIDNCYADMQSLLENAVENACKGNGAKYYPKDATYVYGHCEHQAEILDSAGTPVMSCPAGELLQLLDTSANKMTFKCAKFSITTTCPSWNYIAGVKPDGSANCIDIRTIFPNSGFAVVRNGVYSVQNISCAPGFVLQRIDASGTPVCVNPRYNYTCPVGQYVTGINASGTPQCSYAANQNSCSAPYFMSAIDSVGNVTCKSPALSGNCIGNNVITGVDSSGNVICSLNQP